MTRKVKCVPCGRFQGNEHQFPNGAKGLIHAFDLCDEVELCGKGRARNEHLIQLDLIVDRKCGAAADAIQSSDLTPHTLKLLNKVSDLLKHSMLIGEVIRIQRTHLG